MEQTLRKNFELVWLWSLDPCLCHSRTLYTSTSEEVPSVDVDGVATNVEQDPETVPVNSAPYVPISQETLRTGVENVLDLYPCQDINAPLASDTA